MTMACCEQQKEAGIIKDKELGKRVRECKLKAVLVTKKMPKTWHVFVGRLDPDIVVNSVSDFLPHSGSNVNKCKSVERIEKWHEKFGTLLLLLL